MFISTKGGLIHEDADFGLSSKKILSTLFSKGIINEDDVFQENCIEPKFLSAQIQQSRLNLGLEKIDCYSLNLPEIWLGKISKNDFYVKLLVRLKAGF